MTGGCFTPEKPNLKSENPAAKIPAIKTAVEDKDLSNVRQFIKDLENDDPAVRFYSISALEKLTGQTFGYQYFVDEDKRAQAVEKWKAWLKGWEAAQQQKAS